MIQDVRKGVRSSFLYKRFAYYQSEGFAALIKFLQDEGIFDKFCEEFDFNKSNVERDMKIKPLITINDFFGISSYSFSFLESKYGADFWRSKTFRNYNFNEIKEKLL